MSKTFPRKAFLLAAGRGRRMEPLGEAGPKTLLPLWGVPLLERLLRSLEGAGVRDVLINAHHGATRLVQYVRLRPASGLRISVSHEPLLLDTGGALVRGSWFLPEGLFWLVNTDIAAGLDWRAFYRAAVRKPALATLWVEPSRGPRTLAIEKGQVRSFTACRPGAAGTATLAGVHLLSREILDYLPVGEKPCSIIDAYRRALAAGKCVCALAQAGSAWQDLGTPERYLQAHAEQSAEHEGAAAAADLQTIAALRRAGVTVQGFAAISRKACVTRGARLSDTVLLPGARIGPRARIAAAVVAAGPEFNGRATRLVTGAEETLTGGEQEHLEHLGWAPSLTSVEALAPRGSARSFFRLHKDREHLILMRYSLERPENGLVAGHTEVLQSIGFPVPRILASCPEQHFMLLEDAGRTDLMTLAPRARPEHISRLYRRVLDKVLVLHRDGAVAVRGRKLTLMPPFTRQSYAYEHELFMDFYLERFRGLRHVNRARIRAAMNAFPRCLGPSPRVLLHRDLQSSNVLMHHGRPVFIDFQGMRLGPAAYDLASFLCDPYVELGAEQRLSLLEYYLERAPQTEAIRLSFWSAACQRLIQVLGALGRFSAHPETSRYKVYIPAAERLLAAALQQAQADPLLLRLVG